MTDDDPGRGDDDSREEASGTDDLRGEASGTDDSGERDASSAYWIDLPSIQLPQHVLDEVRAALATVDHQMIARAQEAASVAESFDRAGIEKAARSGAAAAAAAIASIDWAGVATAQQMVSSALASIDWQAFTLPQSFLRSFERLHEAWPPNWDDDTRLDPLSSVVTDDGIPVVWLPRADLLRDVASASNREQRLHLLLEHQADCLEDARAVLSATTHPALAGQVALAFSAVESLASGHHQSAQALSCVVIESATRRDIAEGSRKTARFVTERLEEAVFVELRLWMALAPLARFYDEWRTEKTSGPAPELLNRHATVHGGAPDHFNPGNALVAVLLMASVLRALQELAEEREGRGDPTWPWI